MENVKEKNKPQGQSFSAIQQKRCKERLDALFKESTDSAISGLLGSLGLNMGMFTDRDGGNVTTLHNFEKDTDQFVADKDKSSYQEANKTYNRKEYLDKNFQEKSKQLRQRGIDDYTGKKEDPSNLDTDHIKPLEHEVNKKANHLAYETGTKEGKEKFKTVLNDEKNLATTNSSINRSKGSKTNREYVEMQEKKGTLKARGIDKEKMLKGEAKANKHINTSVVLLKKQASELLSTGGKQAMSQGLKVALGQLLTRVTSIVFTEVKFLLKEESKFSADKFNTLGSRLKRHISQLVKDTPDIFKSALEGGISGFISNLLTFILNSFLSTVKKFVTIIREGLLGIYKALKILFFPPPNMTVEEKWRTATKILSTTILSAVIMSFSEMLKGFFLSIPLLAPFADALAGIVSGILSGVICAIAAYLLDLLFDKIFDNRDEKAIDLSLRRSEEQLKINTTLVQITQISLKNIEIYNQIIHNYMKAKELLKKYASNNEAILARYSQDLDNSLLIIKKEEAIASEIKQLNSREEEIMTHLNHLYLKYGI